ncbi:MAG: hypothetical protein H0T76_17985 [Nannocystis sp.]|nr:hypothetical protein [Nannocystis sp.]
MPGATRGSKAGDGDDGVRAVIGGGGVGGVGGCDALQATSVKARPCHHRGPLRAAGLD